MPLIVALTSLVGKGQALGFCPHLFDCAEPDFVCANPTEYTGDAALPVKWETALQYLLTPEEGGILRDLGIDPRGNVRCDDAMRAMIWMGDVHGDVDCSTTVAGFPLELLIQVAGIICCGDGDAATTCHGSTDPAFICAEPRATTFEPDRVLGLSLLVPYVLGGNVSVGLSAAFSFSPILSCSPSFLISLLISLFPPTLRPHRPSHHRPGITDRCRRHHRRRQGGLRPGDAPVHGIS